MERRTVLKLAGAATAAAVLPAKRFAGRVALRFRVELPRLQCQFYSVGNRGEHIPTGPVVDVGPDDVAHFVIRDGDLPKPPDFIETPEYNIPTHYRYLDSVGVDGVVLIVDGKPLPGHKFNEGFMLGVGMEVDVIDVAATYPGYEHRGRIVSPGLRNA